MSLPALQSWTFTHLYYPDPDGVQGGVESWIIRAMSLPANMGSLRKQFYFTLFYATATVFAFMNSSIYWFVTRQHETAALLVAAATAKGASPSPVLLVVDGPCMSCRCPLPAISV